MSEIGGTVKANYQAAAGSAMEAGDYDTAISNLEKALGIGAQDSNTMFNLAQAYDKKGDTQNANKWYQKIIDDYPGTEDAQNAADYMQANGGQAADADEGQADNGEDGEENSGEVQGASEGEPVTQDE